MENPMDGVKFAWATKYDVENKIVMHLTVQLTEYKIDVEQVDPDGIPLVFIRGMLVTRVRKMTDEEYNTHNGVKINLEYRIVEWPEHKSKDKKEPKVAKP